MGDKVFFGLILVVPIYFYFRLKSILWAAYATVIVSFFAAWMYLGSEVINPLWLAVVALPYFYYKFVFLRR